MRVPNASRTELARRTTDLFRHRFGERPKWVAAAPGRVNLIGEHTDYNDGFVLPMAIDRCTVIAAAPAAGRSSQPDAVVQAYSATLDEQVRFTVGALAPGQQQGWSSYIGGVLAGFRDRGLMPGALNLIVDSSVPMGGGLSSSAALEVATATLLEEVLRTKLTPLEKVLLCQQAEHDYAGVPCGIMDQFASVAGQTDRLLLIDCLSRKIELVPLEDTDVTVLIVNSKVKHELGNSPYAQRRKQCVAAAQALGVTSLRHATLEQLVESASNIDPILRRRARHVISENQRTVRAAAAMRSNYWDEAGRLMYASHASMRDDYEVSCRELDLLVDLASRQDGVIGSRMTGGGFGGCTVSLVRSGAVEVVSRVIAEQYQSVTGILPDVLATRPGPGAGIMDTNTAADS